MRCSATSVEDDSFNVIKEIQGKIKAKLGTSALYDDGRVDNIVDRILQPSYTLKDFYGDIKDAYRLELGLYL